MSKAKKPSSGSMASSYTAAKDSAYKKPKTDLKKKPLARKAAKRAHKAGRTSTRKRLRGF